MGLIIKLDTPVVNADGTAITLTDLTGAYNATTNPTGYNPLNIDSTNVRDVRVSLPGVSGVTVIYSTLTTPTASQILLGLPFTIVASQFGLERFPDSALKICYQVNSNIDELLAYTVGSKIVAGANLPQIVDVVKRVADTGAVAVEISAGVFAFYNVDPTWVYAVGAHDFVIDQQFPYTTASYQTSASASIFAYANVQAEGEECLASAIGELAINLTTSSCKQDKEQDMLMKRYMYSLVAQTKYDCGDFATADRINRYLAAFCGTPSNCGCS